ncbi:MAG: 8-oxo-dGTP diphosphatase [Bdellovibrionales bacterium]|nr:8-oxo-dGTP diphosphatase [Bdellovibrionales bacterium]
MNAFESAQRKMIPAVLVYLFHAGKILMLHRISKDPSRKDDIHKDKWNGLGGKLEADESSTAAVIREVQEESGILLRVDQLQALGTLHFPGFKPKKNEDWMVFVYRAEIDADQAANLITESVEGSLSWIAAEKVVELPLWDGDRHFIPYVLQGKPFQGTYWYVDGALRRHETVVLADASTKR